MQGLKRGCGYRTPGGLYLSCGLSTDGKPVWDYLVDPPTHFTGDPFRGVHIAPPEMTTGWDTDKNVLLLDMVSVSDYRTYASFVEEVRRFGLSRRIQGNFDFEQLQGKKVWLGTIHWNGLPIWPDDAPDAQAALEYRYCSFRFSLDQYAGSAMHYPDCVYHSWPIALKDHETQDVSAETTLVVMPGFTFDPLAVIEGAGRLEVRVRAKELHPISYRPGIFAIWAAPRIEAILYVPEDVDPLASGLPVQVVEE